MECQLCQHHAKDEKYLCRKCESVLRDQLSDIPTLQQESKGFLVPGRTGTGSRNSERSLGFNVAAMDYSTAVDTLPMLHKYEAMIRRARNLTPPALLKKQPSIEAEVAATAQFHITHLGWTLQQDWSGEFAREVKVIHSKGLSVTKAFIETTRRIPCPTEGCKNRVAIDIENILADVFCLKCKGSWTLYRLLQLAMDNPDKRFYLDLEAICLWLNITKKQALKVIDEYDIPKRNGLYDLSTMVRVRNEVASF